MNVLRWAHLVGIVGRDVVEMLSGMRRLIVSSTQLIALIASESQIESGAEGIRFRHSEDTDHDREGESRG